LGASTIADSTKKNYKFKITLFGSANVGKTSLIIRFIKESFSEDLKKTIGTNFLVKDIDLPEENLNARLLIWDIGGQAQFSSLRNMYFKGSNGAIGVYDVTSPESLLRIPGWVSSIKKAVGNIPMILIGNKADLVDQRRVDLADALDLAKRLDCEHIETSAKDGTNVELMFLKIAKKCYENAQNLQAKLDGEMDLGEDEDVDEIQ
jgi:small GTP-binding protein